MTLTVSGKSVAVEGEEMTATPTTATVGEALVACMDQASTEGRMTCGVFECVKLLSCNPDNVMLCVMPEVRSEDVTLHIQHTLIEAFCWENEIKMIKVDSWETLEKLVNEQRARQGLTAAQDVSCLLLEAPKSEESPADRLVSLYWQNFVESPIFPKPPVQLPG